MSGSKSPTENICHWAGIEISLFYFFLNIKLFIIFATEEEELNLELNCISDFRESAKIMYIGIIDLFPGWTKLNQCTNRNILKWLLASVFKITNRLNLGNLLG